MNLRQRLLAIAVPFVVVAAAVGLTQPAAPSLATVNEFNAHFRAVYAQRLAQLEQLEPLITVEGDELVLRRSRQKDRVRTTPDSYHVLKAVAHVPLTIYLTLRRHPGGPLSEERRKELRGLLGIGKRATQMLPLNVLNPEQVVRQKRMLNDCEAFVRSLLEAKEVGKDEATDFARKMTPSIVANVTDAARAQLDSIHRQVQKWRTQLTPAEWQRLKVVVQGPALPRQGNLAVQYFCHALGEKGEGRRVIYAESIFETARALELLATSELDSGIGQAFFNDDRRMHRDLLADAATEYLKQLK